MAITAQVLGRDPDSDDEIYLFKRDDGTIVKFGGGSSGTLKQLDQLRIEVQNALESVESEKNKQIAAITQQSDTAKFRLGKQSNELAACMEAIKAL